MKNIEGKVVVITGASSGLGEETARHLSSLGAKVVLAARRVENLEKIASEISANGNESLVVKADVTKKDDVQNIIDKALDKFGKIDVMINNAGLMSLAPMSALKMDEWDRMIDINIKGVLYGIASALPVFEKQNTGHFINISSIAGRKTFAGSAVYCGTKFAVRAISDSLREEIGGNIRTTIILPGMIDSELKFGSSDEGTSEFIKEMYKGAIAPSSIANAIAYAISQPSEVDVNELIIRPTSQEF